MVPSVIGAHLGLRWGQNAALPAAQTPVVQRWLLEEVMPRLHPRRVVWGVSSIDFNGRRPRAAAEMYDASRATRRGFFADLDRELARTSAVVDYRAVLRDPIELGTDLQTRSSPRPGRRPLEDLLGPLVRSPNQAWVEKAWDYLRETQLGNFEVTTRYANAFRDTLRMLRREGVDTAVVLMPVPSTYGDAHPKGPRQYRAWKRMVRTLAEQANTPVIDLSSSMPDEDLPDFLHLTTAAAREWSALLGGRLAELGWPRRTGVTP